GRSFPGRVRRWTSDGLAAGRRKAGALQQIPPSYRRLTRRGSGSGLRKACLKTGSRVAGRRPALPPAPRGDRRKDPRGRDFRRVGGPGVIRQKVATLAILIWSERGTRQN